MAQGTVKRYDTVKLYGFIAVDGGQDVLVSRPGVPLMDGLRVEFDIIQGLKGLEAKNVRLIT